jgi:hypothetical protein
MKLYKGPQKKIPSELLSAFTLNNKIPVYDYYFEENSVKRIWSNELIEIIKKNYTPDKIKKNNHKIISLWKDRGEPYPDHRIGGGCLLIQLSIDKYPIKNKKVGILGSTSPWIECICLNNNCSNFTTIEYNLPICEDKRFNMITYENFSKNNIKYDVIISYSSIEHSGLGRYGDELDPEGDFKTMDNIYNSLNPKGLLILGIPIGKDALVWNANRIYGELRLSKLLNKFEVLEWIGSTYSDTQKLPKGYDWKSNYQPIIVLLKK